MSGDKFMKTGITWSAVEIKQPRMWILRTEVRVIRAVPLLLYDPQCGAMWAWGNGCGAMDRDKCALRLAPLRRRAVMRVPFCLQLRARLQRAARGASCGDEEKVSAEYEKKNRFARFMKLLRMLMCRVQRHAYKRTRRFMRHCKKIKSFWILLNSKSTGKRGKGLWKLTLEMEVMCIE